MGEDRFIHGPKGLVASVNRRSNGTTETLYYTHDHLGSVDAITTTAGAVSARLSYDLWGKRRNESGWTGALPGADWTAIGNSVRKGFTEHEHLDNLGLVHMNGRVYDPIIGRFLSADPFIPNPMSTQSFNRYSYVQNNPLSSTDPSGFTDRDERTIVSWIDFMGEQSGRGVDTAGMGIVERRWDGVDPPRGPQSDPDSLLPQPEPPVTPTVPDGETPSVVTSSCDGSFLPCSGTGPAAWIAGRYAPGESLWDPSKLFLASIFGGFFRDLLRANNVQHEQGVQQQAAVLTALGFQVLDFETYVTAGGMVRVYDIVVEKDGDIYGVEVKTSRSGELRPVERQVGFDVLTVGEGAIVTSGPLQGQKINGVIYRGVDFSTALDAKWSQLKLLSTLESARIPYHTDKSRGGQ